MQGRGRVWRGKREEERREGDMQLCTRAADIIILHNNDFTDEQIPGTCT